MSMNDDIKTVLVSEEQLKAKVAELGARISKDYEGKNLVLVSILKGSVVFIQTIPSEKGDNPLKKGALWIIRLILNAYVEFFRGTPMMAQAMFIYYGLMPLLGINSTITQAAYFILSINTGAYMAETVRGGILSIDPGQTEGANWYDPCSDYDLRYPASGSA